MKGRKTRHCYDHMDLLPVYTSLPLEPPLCSPSCAPSQRATRDSPIEEGVCLGLFIELFGMHELAFDMQSPCSSTTLLVWWPEGDGRDLHTHRGTSESLMRAIHEARPSWLLVLSGFTRPGAQIHQRLAGSPFSTALYTSSDQNQIH